MDHFSQNRYATAGVLLAVPSVVLVISGFLQLGLGLDEFVEAFFAHRVGHITVHPLTVFGGLTIAIAINMLSVFRLRMEARNGTVSTTIVTRLRPANLAILALNGFLFALLTFYAFTENFMIVSR